MKWTIGRAFLPLSQHSQGKVFGLGGGTEPGSGGGRAVAHNQISFGEKNKNKRTSPNLLWGGSKSWRGKKQEKPRKGLARLLEGLSLLTGWGLSGERGQRTRSPSTLAFRPVGGHVGQR